MRIKRRCTCHGSRGDGSGCRRASEISIWRTVIWSQRPDNSGDISEYGRSHFAREEQDSSKGDYFGKVDIVASPNRSKSIDKVAGEVTCWRWYTVWLTLWLTRLMLWLTVLLGCHDSRYERKQVHAEYVIGFARFAPPYPASERL